MCKKSNQIIYLISVRNFQHHQQMKSRRTQPYEWNFLSLERREKSRQNSHEKSLIAFIVADEAMSTQHPREVVRHSTLKWCVFTRLTKMKKKLDFKQSLSIHCECVKGISFLIKTIIYSTTTTMKMKWKM